MGCGASKVAPVPSDLEDSKVHVRETGISRLSTNSLQKDSKSVANGNTVKKSKTKENDFTKDKRKNTNSIASLVGDEGRPLRPPNRLAPLNIPNHGKGGEVFVPSTISFVSEEGNNNFKKTLEPERCLENEASALPNTSSNSSSGIELAKTKEEIETSGGNVKGQQSELSDNTLLFQRDILKDCSKVEDSEGGAQKVEEEIDINHNETTKCQRAEPKSLEQGKSCSSEIQEKTNSAAETETPIEIEEESAPEQNQSIECSSKQDLKADETESSDPKLNYAAMLSQLILDVGLKTLRKKFDTFYPPEKLRTSLKCRYKALLSLRSKRLLKNKHWVKLFPHYPTHPDSNTFDWSLLYLLFRTICNLTPPPTGWNSMPPSADRSVSANLVRIVFFRKSVLQHERESSFDETTFENLWHDVSMTLVELGADEKDVFDLRKVSFVADGEVYVKRLSEWDLEEEELRHVSPVRPLKSRRSSLLDDIHKLRRESKYDSMGKISLDGRSESIAELELQPDIKGLMGSYETDIERLAGLYEKDTRKFILSEVDTWMDNRNSERVLLLSGIAGSGKSVISAVVCKDAELRGCLAASQFFQQDNHLLHDPRRMLCSLAQQLCTNIPLFQRNLNNSLQKSPNRNLNLLSVKELFLVLFEEPLKNFIDPGKNFLIVLDGLNECMYHGRLEIVDILINYFSRLPLWVKLFLTTQPLDEIMKPLNRTFQVKALKSDDTTARDDIKLCYQRKLSTQLQGEATRDEALVQLVDKSCGIFLYSRLIWDYLFHTKADITPDSLARLLPSTLYSICDEYFKSVHSKLNCSEQDFSDFLCAVTAALEPLPIGFVLKILNLHNVESTKIEKNTLCTAFEGLTPLLQVYQESVRVTHKCVVDLMPNLSSQRIQGNLILYKMCENILDSLHQRSNISLEDLCEEDHYALRNYLCHLCGSKNNDELQLIAKHLLDVAITSAKLLIHFSAVEELQYYLTSRSFSSEVVNSMEAMKKCVYLYESLGVNNIHLFLQILSQNERCSDLANEAKELVVSSKFGHGVTINSTQIVPSLDKSQGLYVMKTFPISVEVAAYAISPDYKLLVCAGGFGSSTTIYLWSIVCRSPRWKRKAIGEVANNNITFSPDGSVVLTGCLTHAHRVTDGKQVEFFPTSDHRFKKCAYTPNKAQLLTVDATDDSSLCLWDMANGHQIFRIGTEGCVEDFAFSRCGKLLACVNTSVDETPRRRLGLWEIQESNPKQIAYKDVSPSTVCTLAFSPDSHYVICGTDTVTAWGMKSNGNLEEVAVTLPPDLEGADLTGTASNSTTTSEILLLFSKESKFHLVEIEPQETTIGFKVLLTWCHVSQLRARSAHVLSDGTCALVRYLYTPDLYLVTNNPNRIQQMKISRDGSTLGVLCDNTFMRYTFPGGELLYKREILDEETGDIQHFVESRGKPCAIISTYDGELKLWEIDTDSGYPHTVTDRGQCVVSAKSLDDNRVAVRNMANLKRIRIWNADTLKEEMAFDHKTDLLNFDVSVDGEYVVSCDIEGNISCWNVHDRSQSKEMTIPHAEWVKAWPDERIIVTGGSHSNHAINLWDRTTGELVRSFVGHTNRVIGCAPIRNGSLMVSFSQDKTIRVWKVVTGELIGFMHFHEAVDSLATCSAKDDFVLSFSSGEIRAVEFQVPEGF